MNGVVVDAELPGNGASAPLLEMVIAQDLGLQFKRYGHRYPQDGDVRMAWRRRRGSRRTNGEQQRLHQSQWRPKTPPNDPVEIAGSVKDGVSAVSGAWICVVAIAVMT
ncbi:hypothetical protein NKI25_34460 [Mesorhizobium sp. M0808]|uniref:hypothetical protein n=1 Tax=Mesorhizobium sp. M0808 TaxID=2957002 RepID=UPI00333CDF43